MGEAITIAAIPITLVEFLWDRVEGYLQDVVDVAHDEMTINSIKSRIMSGDTLLIVIMEGVEIIAVNVLEVREFESGIKALYIPITGGKDLDKWMPQFLTVAKNIAEDHGCAELRGLAVRDGWIRKLKKHGWEPVHTVIKCEV